MTPLPFDPAQARARAQMALQTEQDHRVFTGSPARTDLVILAADLLAALDRLDALTAENEQMRNFLDALERLRREEAGQ